MPLFSFSSDASVPVEKQIPKSPCIAITVKKQHSSKYFFFFFFAQARWLQRHGQNVSLNISEILLNFITYVKAILSSGVLDKFKVDRTFGLIRNPSAK